MGTRRATLNHRQAVALMVLVTLLWSIAGVVTRQLDSARSFEVTFWRSFFTALSLLILLPVWQGRQVFRRMPWRSTSLWLSGLCWSVMFTAFMVALTLTSVANVLVIMAAGPLLTALLARLVVAHRLPLRTWGAIAVAGLGIGYMYGNPLAIDSDRTMAGTLVALCVPLAGAVQWTLVQRSRAQGETLDLVPSVLLGAVLSALTALPLSLPFAATPSDVGWLALLGLVQLAIPCTLSVICARVLKAPEVALLALLEVIFGIALAWLGANEIPGRDVLVGGGLVIGALIFNELLGWRRQHD